MQNPKQKFIDFVLDNKSNCCGCFLEQDNGSLFRGFLMPLVLKTYYPAFKDFSCGIVGEFGISQKDTQDVLRNKWGGGGGEAGKSRGNQPYSQQG